MEKKRRDKRITSQEDESKTAGPPPIEAPPALTFDEYQCTGNVKIDFPALCGLLQVKDIPSVHTRVSTASTTEQELGTMKNTNLETDSAALLSKPQLVVELENDDTHSAKEVIVSGWKVSDRIFRALLKTITSMTHLQGLHFWQAGLKEELVSSLMHPVPVSSSLRSVKLEGNVIPKQSFHLLLTEDSVWVTHTDYVFISPCKHLNVSELLNVFLWSSLTHLSLRNNWIEDEGSRLIGAALSTATSANKSLLSLNLSFNCIGDAGAMYIAQGLRLNRTLLFLSLSNNYIGDSGAAHLAMVLGEFALTHEEVVVRRRLILQKLQAESLQSEQANAEQSAPVPETALVVDKVETKSSHRKREGQRKDYEKNTEAKESSSRKGESRVSESKSRKQEQKEKQPPVVEEDLSVSQNKEPPEPAEKVHPLLDQSVCPRDWQVFMSGNNTLASLNLAGNRITEKSLPLFLQSLEMQNEKRSLQRLCLQKNLFPLDCECYMKIKTRMEPPEVSAQENAEPTKEEET